MYVFTWESKGEVAAAAVADVSFPTLSAQGIV